jgi:predicted GNAT family acetyltransferase
MPSNTRRLTDHERALHAAAQARYVARQGGSIAAKHTPVSAAWRKRNRHKACAHNAVYRAIKAGILVRPQSCSACGVDTRPIEASHDGYDKPLAVEWLCRSCHGGKDRRLFDAIVQAS